MSRWDVVMLALTAVMVLGALVFALAGCQAITSSSVGQTHAANSASVDGAATMGWESADVVREPIGRAAAQGGWTDGTDPTSGWTRN